MAKSHMKAPGSVREELIQSLLLIACCGSFYPITDLEITGVCQGSFPLSLHSSYKYCENQPRNKTKTVSNIACDYSAYQAYLETSPDFCSWTSLFTTTAAFSLTDLSW